MTAKPMLPQIRLWHSWVLFFFGSLVCLPNACGESFQLFYLAVGSSVYLKPADKECEGFLDNSGMNKSAKFVAQRLQNCGASFGITLISDTGLRKAVSLSDIQSALSEVRSVINATRPTNPLVVFYFAGHGISEGLAWN